MELNNHPEIKKYGNLKNLKNDGKRNIRCPIKLKNSISNVAKLYTIQNDADLLFILDRKILTAEQGIDVSSISNVPSSERSSTERCDLNSLSISTRLRTVSLYFDSGSKILPSTKN